MADARAKTPELLATEEVNRRIMEAMPGGIVHVRADGSIVAANAEALRVLGLSYDALTKKYTVDFDTETVREDGSPFPAADYPVSKALATGLAQAPQTIGVRRPDGTVAWAVFTAAPLLSAAQGTVEGAIVTFLDITARKAAEAALRESEGLLRSILESSQNPIATADRDGRILFVNRAPATVDRAAMLGRPAWMTCMPEDRDTVERAVATVISTGQTQLYEVKALSGRRYLVHASPRYNGEEIVGVTFVTWDVTAQRDLEARLAIADRMASIGTLAAGMAHEVNNPLTYMLANLEWLERGLRERGADEDLRTWAAASTEGCRRIQAIVSDLSSFSHVGAAGRVVLDLRQMIESSIRMADSEIRCRAHVVREYGDVPPLLASDSRVGQVFLNLLVNAAQAIPEGSPGDNEIKIVVRAGTADQVVVEVSDTGGGVAPDMLERIFDPFVTTKPMGSGTGLGLYICRNIVESLGGTISVVSRLGEGTMFRVTLPASRTVAPPAHVSGGATAADRAHASRPIEQSAAPRRLRILVADDEPNIAAVLAALLADHDVSVARSGREAIAKFSAGEYDLVLCDLIMGDLTGMDLHAHVQAERPGQETRIVFMTGGAFTERARSFLEAIPNPVLPKPFSPRELLDIVAGRAAAARG